MSAARNSEVVYPFHFSTFSVTLLATFGLFVLVGGAPWTTALISLVGVITGFAKALVPGRVRLPLQRVGLPVGLFDGLIAVACFALPLLVGVAVGLS